MVVVPHSYETDVCEILWPCRWRKYKGARYDFTLLDRNGGAAFDLARRLLAPRDKLKRLVRPLP